MLGLTFQDDAPSFDAGLSAFIDELGNAASRSAQVQEDRPHRGKLATRRHPRYEHRLSGLGSAQHSGALRKTRHGEAGRDRVATSSLNRMQSWGASLACALGFEIADADSSTLG